MATSGADFATTAAATEGPTTEGRVARVEPTATTPLESTAGPPVPASEAAAEQDCVQAGVLGNPGGGSRPPVIDVGRNMIDEILALKAEQKKARDAKVAVTKQLRNAERRRQRLKRRAKALSDQDLLAVISLRNHEKALGACVLADNEDGDDESDSEQDDSRSAAASSSAGVSQSPAKQKRRNTRT